MPVTIAPHLKPLIEGHSSRPATAWKFERTDGVIVRLTDHDHLITVDGEQYTPLGSPNVSAKRRDTSLKDHQLEMRGSLTDDAFNHDDLHAGRWRGTKVTERLFDWRYAWAGSLYSLSYWIKKTEWDGEQWNCEIEGLSQFLKPHVGNVYTRTCRFKVGSSECGVNMTPHTEGSCVVLGTLDGQKKRIIRATTASIAGTWADNYFAKGDITWTSGANDGLSEKVKAYTRATRDIELQLEMPFEIAAGDTFILVAGCNGTRDHCLNKFGNADNNGAFWFIGGNDRLQGVTPQ